MKRRRGRKSSSLIWKGDRGRNHRITSRRGCEDQRTRVGFHFPSVKRGEKAKSDSSANLKEIKVEDHHRGRDVLGEGNRTPVEKTTTLERKGGHFGLGVEEGEAAFEFKPTGKKTQVRSKRDWGKERTHPGLTARREE